MIITAIKSLFRLLTLIVIPFWIGMKPLISLFFVATKALMDRYVLMLIIMPHLKQVKKLRFSNKFLRASLIEVDK